MKKVLLIFCGIPLIMIVVVLLSKLLFDSEETPSYDDSSIEDITSLDPVTVEVPETPTIPLENAFGPSVQVNNFLKKPGVVPDMQNQGVFFLGNSFAPNSSGELPPYVIVYTQDTSFFNITLLSEPFGVTRTSAETYLKDLLETSESELCLLNYTVSVPDYVSNDFAGKDVRFSFCPGNTALPNE